MSSAQKRQYIFGACVAVAVLIFIVATFMLLSQTNYKETQMNASEDMGWSYELISGSEARPVSPEFIDDFNISFQGESCRAVRMKRTLSEELFGAQLGVYLYDAVCGVDILVDNKMLYTSFEGAPRDKSGFALTDGFEPSRSGTVEVYLPEDYLGKELTMVTYFPSETTEIVPVFPYLCSVDTAFSVTSVDNVLPIFRTTLCAILAFLTALVYFLDVSNGKANKKVLLLTLFFVMLAAEEAFSSLAGTYSLFTEKLNMFDFVCELYMAPLLMFAAFCLTSWRRWTLAAATGAWFIYDFIRLIRSRIMYGAFFGRATAPVILILYLLALALIIIEMKRRGIKPSRKLCVLYAGIAAAAAVSRILLSSAEWEGDVSMHLWLIFIEPLHGYFYTLMNFVTYVCAVTTTAAVIIEFAKRTLRTRELINALEAQNRRAMEGFRRMAESEEETYSARHEMRHHMLMLSGMLKDGAADKAREYAAALTEEYDELPAGQYSKNTMVNIIAGSYLSRAKAHGVEVKYSFNLPETLPIADTNLCVFLTNLFENAVQACEKVDASKKRYINTKMYINGNCLFISCTNSAPQFDPEIRKDRVHGYGLENMRQIAEKYGGIVKIDRTEGEFSIKSGLYMNGSD